MTIVPFGVSIAPALESPPAPIQACTPSATVTRCASGFCSVMRSLLSSPHPGSLRSPTLPLQGRAKQELLQLFGPDQVRELLLGERGGQKLVLHCIRHD